MNRDAMRTLVYGGVAAALGLLTLVTAPRAKNAEVFSDQGQPFYAAFVDPLKAASLEVVEYDEATGSARPFKVQVVNGRWSIPSHHNYPADGKDRLAKTAASMLGLSKGTVQTENPKDHEALQVIDPLDPAATGTKGRGRRVRLYDAAGAPLADYVFGKDAGEGRRYVRVPEDKKRVYVVKVSLDVSTKFEDWVETDLLQLAGGQLRKLVIDKYSFDEEQGQIKDRNTLTLSRAGGSDAWALGGLKPEEELNAEPMSTLTSTLDDLRLAGVRPKPKLVAQAKNLGDLSKLPREAIMAIARELAPRGFFVSRGEKEGFWIVCNEGEVEAGCDDGVVYQLRFGEVLLGTGEEVSAGKDEEKKDPKKDDKQDEKKEAPKSGSQNRYLFLSVRFDDALLDASPVEPKPYVADASKKPEEQKAEEEKSKKEKEEFDRKKKEFDEKKDAGKKRADKLAARFADWYYVISDESFKKLRLDRPQLVKAKEKPPEEKKPEPPKDEKKPDDKKAEPPKEEKKPEPPKEEKKPDAPKPPEEKKAEAPKPEEKKPEPPKPEEKKP